MLRIELNCLSTAISPDNTNELSNLIQDSQDILLLLLQRKYEECLQMCKQNLNIDSLENLSSLLTTFCKDSNNKKQETIFFCCGVSCLQLFVQRNWLGPFKTTEQPWPKNKLDDVQNCAFNLLQLEGNSVPKSCQLLPYLVIAQSIFECLTTEDVFKTANWWLLRCYAVHSHVLNEHSEALYEKSKVVIEKCLSEPFLNEPENGSYLLQLNLEVGIVLLHYYQYKQANEHFEQANTLSGITFGFTGAMGVRTKFQQKPVAQLLLTLERREESNFTSKVHTDHNNVPKDLALNDDTLLEKIKFSEDREIITDLSPEQLATILAKSTYMQKASPSHKLQQEEIGAIIQYLLSCKSCWCIQNEALRLRCNTENERSRTVERCMTQMEILVNLATKKDENSPQRLDMFYSIFSPPIWQMEKNLATLFISLGATSAAMDIYKRLEMWEDAILCLIQSNRGDEALDMINLQLETNETPNLWCLLGDIKREPKHYEKAWELSKHRSSRAMKSLGAYYCSKRQYTEAVECFDKSLAILSLQTETWFTLGCACLTLENFEKAAQSFRRCVGLNWDNFEAWSNLSAAYIKCDKRNQAFKALTEAIKCNFNKWQLWENYLLVSTDVGQFNEAIIAYGRLLDIKNKYVDVPVLRALVRVVVEDIPNAKGIPGSTFKPKLLQLFGHVTSKVTNEYEIWELYARLCGMALTDDQAENTKAIQHLHKALRVGLQKNAWEKNDDTIKSFIQISEDIEKGCQHCRETIDVQTLSSIRLTLKGFSGKLKQREKMILEVSDQENIASFAQEVNNFADKISQLVVDKKSQ